MRQLSWTLALGAAAAIALTGCPAQDEREGGGGGRVTIDDSNPVTSEERTDRGVALRARPQHQEAGEKAKEPESTVIARGGEATLKVDVNSASVEELMKVPGIGYDMARAIVQNRPYKDAEDMANQVPNLPLRQVQSFEQYLVFGGGGK